MQYKSGVKLRGIRAEIAAALPVICSVLGKYGNVVITSVVEGSHAPTSKHYIGCAVDVRSRHMREDQVKQAVWNLQLALTEEFVVLAEADHIHIQFGHKGEVL